MTPPNNPTSLASVVGEEIAEERASHPTSTMLKQLVMPAILAAFASYLLFGIVTMRVPEGVAFPGPRFFPLIIMGGLYLFAVLLAIQAFRDRSSARAALEGTAGDAGASNGPGSADRIALVADEGEAAAAPHTADASDDDPADGAAPQPGIDWRSMAWIVGAFIGFALTLPWLGWIIAAALLFWCVARAFGAGRPLFNLLVGLTASSIAYIVFNMLLGLPLPSGILGWGF
ncbi:tripartite tricarboxylate transporter TctB family protein [Leucobacter massiliensis]|uniref:DUF1468 domain-containing protein n=1 Tax=Leucobacter massiliensis TaxID=1686285 RepID=A0A2S9QKH0_9MICO|nr:tripartite tricarboxylate transporter TctB family protein [Leucobacter massiliensis]PRI10079.1 hypothetical protein B4915_13145 [Leucobacter massiliensis]